MFVLKTARATRYFCSFCKSVLILYEDTAERFVAVCPKYHRYNSNTHDNLHLSFPPSALETCPYCGEQFKPGIDCLDAKNYWRCPHCESRLQTSSSQPFRACSNEARSPIVEDALRIFSPRRVSRTGFYRGTPINWGQEFEEDEKG